MPMRPLKSVLCADDDPDIGAAVQATLRLVAGLDVRVAESGETLIRLALEQTPDLVLLDVVMPGLDGPATFLRMRGSPLLRKIPVIFLTAKVTRLDVQRMFSLGALGLITKPIDAGEFGERMSTLWNKADMPSAIAGPGVDLADADGDPLAAKFLRRASASVASLRTMIDRALQGDSSALQEVENIAHKIHGSGAMFGFHSVSALGEAIEHLASGIIAHPDAHGPIAESALVQQLSDCIERLARAIEAARRAGHCSGRMAQRAREA